MTYLYIAIGIVLIYLFFSFFPSLFMFRSIFCDQWNKNGKQPTRRDYALPYLAQLEEAEALLQSLPCSERSLSARDGVTLRADWYDRGSCKTAVLLHGYRATPAANCSYTAKLLWEAGYNLLLPYQRAHGKSDGRFSSMGLYEQYDLLSWIDLAAADERVTHIAVCGTSMGASSAAFASDKIMEPKVKALVLDCGFTSVQTQLASDCKKWRLPVFLVMPLAKLFYRIRFHSTLDRSTEDSLRNCRTPALFIHGTDDTSVRVEQGIRNYEACGAEKQVLIVPNAPHIFALPEGGRAAADTLLTFLGRYIPG